MARMSIQSLGSWIEFSGILKAQIVTTSGIDKTKNIVKLKL